MATIMENTYQFGSIRYNTDKRELMKQDKAVYLRRKVAAVLEMLVENRHRIVEHEELLTSIWREGRMRENSLLQCIRELRKILGDNAQQPQFIKTYHTKGYQWIYTQTVTVSAKSGVLLKPVTIDAPTIVSTAKYPPFPHSLKFITQTRFIMASSIVLLLGLVSFLYGSMPAFIKPTQTQHDGITLAILPFANHTGDTSLAWVKMGLSDMVMSALAQSSQITVIPIHVVQEIQLAHQPSPTEDQLLTALNADYLIKSQITLAELSPYQFTYHLFNQQGVVDTQTLPISDVIAAIPAIVTRLSHQLIPDNNDLIPLLALSSNHQANQDYANGIHALRTKGSPLAKRYFEAALLNDPDFIWAKAQLAQTLSTLGDWQIAKTQFQAMLQQPAINHDFALKRFVQFSLGNILLDQSRLNQAETLFHSVIKLSEQANDRYNQVNALWQLSKISEYRSQWDQQQAYAQQAMLLTDNVNDLQSKADNLYYLGSPSNSRLEFDEHIDMQQNRLRLEQALKYYHQLNDVPSQARTLLSMGQNYTFEFEQRLDFLQQAAQLSRQLNNKMQWASTLSYTGFLYIQYHRGDEALIPLQTSFQITKTIGAVQVELLNRFLLAFSALDQGMTHQADEEKTQHFNIAAQLFIALRDDSRLRKDSQLFADASLLLGWTVSEQGHHQQAIDYIKQAWQVYRDLKMTTSTAYSVMSLVKEHVDMQNWQQALEYINSPHPSKRTRQYFARSYYELNQYHKALTLAALNKSLNASQWTAQDNAQLERYRQVDMTNQYLNLPPEPSAHATYCETLPPQENRHNLL